MLGIWVVRVRSLLEMGSSRQQLRWSKEQKSIIEELKRKVNVVEAELAEEKARRTPKRTTTDDGVQSAGHPQAFTNSNSAFVSPGGMSNEEVGRMCNTKEGAMSPNATGGMSNNQSQLKTYVRIGSRRRYKSQLLRIPYTANVVVIKKNE
ncbi:uncharacterized protein LOC106780705 isoform X1 [Vigna radiata var. radiata]|uniref:Uncharacterized protein LOC106780705 isoform X1 n=1 Tax=Vigna radiata var. radiata TaxID=3916 RepID=A0A3Q0EMB9_VIGRR|nr:uncharacterized protein LOC106780705 isoform X1 [Vigna radiata var. radiata]